MAAAVGSLMILKTLSPAITPASLVAWRWENGVLQLLWTERWQMIDDQLEWVDGNVVVVNEGGVNPKKSLFKPKPILEAEGVIGLNGFFYKKVWIVRFSTFMIMSRCKSNLPNLWIVWNLDPNPSCHVMITWCLSGLIVENN